MCVTAPRASTERTSVPRLPSQSTKVGCAARSLQRLAMRQSAVRFVRSRGCDEVVLSTIAVEVEVEVDRPRRGNVLTEICTR